MSQSLKQKSLKQALGVINAASQDPTIDQALLMQVLYDFAKQEAEALVRAVK